MARGFKWLVGASAALLFAGCAAVVTKDSPAEAKREAVRERALARWELIIKGQADKAYDYFSSASRQVISREDFAARMSKTAFRTATVEKVECSEESCRAWVRITYDHPMMKGVFQTMQESWLLENRNAWFVWSV
jgi:hypothetical protein